MQLAKDEGFTFASLTLEQRASFAKRARAAIHNPGFEVVQYITGLGNDAAEHPVWYTRQGEGAKGTDLMGAIASALRDPEDDENVPVAAQYRVVRVEIFRVGSK